MNWDGARQMLRNGGKITRPSWEPEHFWKLSKDGYERILCHDGTNASVHIRQIEADDWELWKEETLSDEKVNVLINVCRLDNLVKVPKYADINITMPKESMQFQDGYLKEGVKECIKDIIEIVGTDYIKSTKIAAIKRRVGVDLC